MVLLHGVSGKGFLRAVPSFWVPDHGVYCPCSAMQCTWCILCTVLYCIYRMYDSSHYYPSQLKSTSLSVLCPPSLFFSFFPSPSCCLPRLSRLLFIWPSLQLRRRHSSSLRPCTFSFALSPVRLASEYPLQRDLNNGIGLTAGDLVNTLSGVDPQSF